MRYIGDRVAVVAADTIEAAEAAALLVEVDYDELPAVFDPIEAMRDEAEPLHPDADAYVGRPQNPPRGVNNLAGYGELAAGDIEQGFAQAGPP